jgi:hypothetical protein
VPTPTPPIAGRLKRPIKGHAAAEARAGRGADGVTAREGRIPGVLDRGKPLPQWCRGRGHAPEVAGTGRGWTNPSARNVSYTVFVSVAIWSSAVALFSPMAMISPESGK